MNETKTEEQPIDKLSWKDEQRVLTRRAERAKAVKPGISKWRDSRGVSYEKLENGQIVRTERK